MVELISPEIIGLIIERAGLSILLFVLVYILIRSSSAERKALLEEASEERKALIAAVLAISQAVETLKQTIHISNETDARSAETLRQNTMELGRMKLVDEQLTQAIENFHREYNRRNEDLRDMVFQRGQENTDHMQHIKTELDGLKTQQNILAKNGHRHEKGLYQIWLSLNELKRKGASIGGAD